MSRDVVGVELFRVRHYLEEVGTAATAVPGSSAFVGAVVSVHELERVVTVTLKARANVELLDSLWWRLRQPGLVNILRRCLMRDHVLQELRDIRSALDAVRVGHHPRWGALKRLSEAGVL